MASELDSSQRAELEAELVAGRLTGFGQTPKGELVLGIVGKDSPDLEEYARKWVLEPRGAVDEGRVTFGGLHSFFEGEVRPGSGFIRVVGDSPVLPGGCVGLFLRKSGRSYLSAGHVVSNDWSEGLSATVHRDRATTTGPGRRLFLGTVKAISETKETVGGNRNWNNVDAAIVDFAPGVPLDDDPTCFEKFSALATTYGIAVKKCGSQEPYFTDGEILSSDYCTAIVRNGRTYLFKNQLLVKSAGLRPFAKPGDSGTMVVNSFNEVVGMLIGGNVLRDEFIVNRVDELYGFWTAAGYRSSLEFQSRVVADSAKVEPASAQPPEVRNFRIW